MGEEAVYQKNVLERTGLSCELGDVDTQSGSHAPASACLFFSHSLKFVNVGLVAIVVIACIDSFDRNPRSFVSVIAQKGWMMRCMQMICARIDHQHSVPRLVGSIYQGVQVVPFRRTSTWPCKAVRRGC